MHVCKRAIHKSGYEQAGPPFNLRSIQPWCHGATVMAPCFIKSGFGELAKQENWPNGDRADSRGLRSDTARRVVCGEVGGGAAFGVEYSFAQRAVKDRRRRGPAASARAAAPSDNPSANGHATAPPPCPISAPWKRYPCPVQPGKGRGPRRGARSAATLGGLQPARGTGRTPSRLDQAPPLDAADTASRRCRHCKPKTKENSEASEPSWR